MNIPQAALTVMMRLVFLFCAEERDLLLLGDELYDRNYAVSTLREQLRTAADQHGEEILGLRHDAWTRLLTTFRAIFAGVKHDRIKLPAYGGSLFNPDRFPFLEGRALGTNWKATPATPLPISNRTVLHLLEALQILQVKVPGGGAPEARKLSFRELDIEQIGHVYEGLLDHTALRAAEPFLGLQGTKNTEPEISLAQLESVAAKGEKELLKFLKEETGRSEAALKKGLGAKIDDQLASRFRTMSQDAALWKRVEPFAGLVRLDTNGYPIVITAGSVFVTAGTDRRSSGTHYTPKTLTEPIVLHTLEPLVYIGPAEGLPREDWKLRAAGEILALRCCDMACGSGAFLVQVCRYLTIRLLEAWDIVQRANPDAINITPEGQPSTGMPDELLIPLDSDERGTFALRIVAQQCVYGVDKNPLAVEMAKLSLWLLTLAKDKPFEFLDHAIRTGDSLVGIHSLEQLRTFSLDGNGEANPLFLYFLDDKIREVIALRRRITTMQAVTARDVEAQERMLREASEAVKRLKGAADLLVAVEFISGSAADRKAARAEADQMVARYFDGGDAGVLRRKAAEMLGGLVPFHWVLEFPEVMVERGGFDAFVGNPPFMGGQKITGNLGIQYRDYLVAHLAGNQSGSANLCGYFLLKANFLVNSQGYFGVLCPDSIAQGVTREVCLDPLVEAGGTFSRAISSCPWPGHATVYYAIVWYSKGSWNGMAVLDGRPVKKITSFLSPAGEINGPPKTLWSMTSRSFQGAIVLGQGFLLSPSAGRQLIERDSRNREVLSPFLTGEDLNASQVFESSRWAINFYDWPLSRGGRGTWSAATPSERKAMLTIGVVPDDYSDPVAADYPNCLSIVEETVKPERTRLKPDGEYVLRKPLPQKWWIYAEKRPGLYAAIAELNQVVVISRITNYVLFAMVPSNMVFSDRLAVFAYSDFGHFAVLQSTLHYVWAWKYSVTNLSLLSYSPSACFETFPFPISITAVEQLGSLYHSCRSRIMRSQGVGLTELYNHYHDNEAHGAEINELRAAHVEMDNAVAAAYGWTDLDLAHGFHETKQGIRFTISEAARREVLARLLKLNHERYEEEVRQGLHDKKKGKPAKGKGKGAGTAASLFD